jgi:RNA polymerase sigma-70 factor, ECF subfamily
MAASNRIALAVEAARAGDLTAFAALVEATQDMAYAVAWQVLREEADARDVVQEAYLKAFERLADLADPRDVCWLAAPDRGLALFEFPAPRAPNVG